MPRHGLVAIIGRRMARTAPGLVVVLVTLLVSSPLAQAGSSAARCKGKRACKARAGSGWHHGTYDGGPGDPIIAPLPSRPG